MTAVLQSKDCQCLSVLTGLGCWCLRCPLAWGSPVFSRWGRHEANASPLCSNYSLYREPCKDVVWPRDQSQEPQHGLDRVVCMPASRACSVVSTFPFTEPLPLLRDPGEEELPPPLLTSTPSESDFGLCLTCWLLPFPSDTPSGNLHPMGDSRGHSRLPCLCQAT